PRASSRSGPARRRARGSRSRRPRNPSSCTRANRRRDEPMARALWKGSISFGLVEIPVALVTGTSDEGDISFAQVDRRNMARVGYKRVNKETGEEVPWGEIVRGYEYEPDEYVILSDQDIASANVKASKTVEIVNFVDQDEIDPMLY